MTAFRLPFIYLFAVLAVEISTVTCRAVNISNIWFLPQEGFPVFYRYFRDRITWFEADAVCQFHHANLVTVDTSKQYDTTRAYLKELDIVNNVWIGLKKKGPNDEFLWTDYKVLNQDGGYWQEQIPKSEAPLCAAIDPAADFRWHSLNCGGPEVASFICELPVPPWAKKSDGCMLTALPSLTVTYLPEQAAVELTSDCGLDGTRQIACKGQADHNEMMHQLSCDNNNDSSHEVEEEDKPVSASSTTLGTSSGSSSSASETESHQPPTRHRRDADDISHLLSDIFQSTRTIAEATTTNSKSPVTTTTYDTSSTIMITSRAETTPTPSFTTSITSSEGVNTTNSLTESPTVSSFEQETKTMKTTSATYFTTNAPENISALHVTVQKQKTAEGTTYYKVSKEIISPTTFSTSITVEPTTSPNNIPEKLPTSTTSAMLTEMKEITTITSENKTEYSTEGIQSNTEQFQNESLVTPANNVTLGKNITYITNNSISTLEEETVSFKQNESIINSKTNDSDDKEMKDSQKENRRRQLLPTPLRDLPEKEDNQTNKSVTKSLNDWNSDDQQDDGGQLQAIDIEVPTKPNRGRRLTRPQGHSFYPYFLNRVLG